MRGIFVVTHPTHLSPKNVERRAREYLARQENLEPEVREHALNAVKAHLKRSRDISNLLKRSLAAHEQMEQPTIFFDPGSPNTFHSKEPLPEAAELYMQALIYGDFDHFVNHKDAFSFGHEYGHRMAQVFDHGIALEEMAYNSHGMLDRLARQDELSADQIDELWHRFQAIREDIDDVVQKFEPIEEIFATYVGLRCLPVDARNNVEPLVIEEMRKRKWDKVYEAFAKLCDASDDPLGTAALICEPACLMLLKVDMDALELLSIFLKIHRSIWSSFDVIVERIEQQDANALDTFGGEDWVELIAWAERLAAEKINLLLDDAHIPRELYWSASQTLRARHMDRAMLISEAFRNNDFADLQHKLHGCTPKVMLIGSPAKEFIALHISSCKHVIEDENMVLAYSLARIFYESLAEQILEKCDSLVCPFGPRRDRKKCCGRREWLEMLHKRLPDKYKKYITLQNCVPGR